MNLSKKNAKKFARIKKNAYLCIAFQEKRQIKMKIKKPLT